MRDRKILKTVPSTLNESLAASFHLTITSFQSIAPLILSIQGADVELARFSGFNDTLMQVPATTVPLPQYSAVQSHPITVQCSHTPVQCSQALAPHFNPHNSKSSPSPSPTKAARGESVHPREVQQDKEEARGECSATHLADSVLWSCAPVVWYVVWCVLAGSCVH